MQKSGNAQATKSDGTLAWTQNVSTATSLTPDFQGGLVVANMNANPATVQKLDGMTGTANQLYTYASPNNPPVLVHANSTIFTVDNNSIVGVNPATGEPSFAPVPLEMGVGPAMATAANTLRFRIPVPPRWASQLSLATAMPSQLGSLFTMDRHSASDTPDTPDTPAFICQREQFPCLIQNARFEHQSLFYFSQGLR
jgi:hypothetical protein